MKEHIIKCLNLQDIQNSDQFDINSNQFYVHYPNKVSQTLSYGRNNNCQLAIGADIYYTEKFFPMLSFDIPLQKLFNRQDYAIGLGKDGKIYISGKNKFWGNHEYMTSLGDLDQDILPNQQIIDLRCGEHNCALLTKSHQIWIHGISKGLHIDDTDNPEPNFKYKARPNEMKESVIGWDMGIDYHAYITDNGKLYAVGNVLLEHLYLNRSDSQYTELPLPAGLKPIKPV